MRESEQFETLLLFLLGFISRRLLDYIWYLILYSLNNSWCIQVSGSMGTEELHREAPVYALHTFQHIKQQGTMIYV